MPLLKIKNESYFGSDTLKNVVNYIVQCGDIGGLAVNPEYAVEQMLLVKRLWYKADTERRQVRHFIVSFADNKFLDDDEALQYGYQICSYYGNRFQVVFGLHLNTCHMHLHFAVNTVSYVDGRMISEGYPDYEKLRCYIQTLMPQWKVTLVSDCPLEEKTLF